MMDYKDIDKQLEKRQREAEKLAKRLDAALKHIEEKVPLYNGKGGLMDRVTDIRGGVLQLGKELELERHYLGQEEPKR